MPVLCNFLLIVFQFSFSQQKSIANYFGIILSQPAAPQIPSQSVVAMVESKILLPKEGVRCVVKFLLSVFKRSKFFTKAEQILHGSQTTRMRHKALE